MRKAAIIAAAITFAPACGEDTVRPVRPAEGCPNPPDRPPTDDPRAVLIDDLEGDQNTFALAAHEGAWSIYQDGTDPDWVSERSSRCAAVGRRALHLEAPNGLTMWGGFDLFLDDRANAVFDARPYTAISFWAATGAGMSGRTYELLAGLQTTTVHGTRNMCTMCGDLYGIRVEADRSWRHVRIPFADIKQAGWGRPSGLPLRLDQVVTFTVRFSGAFDLWIDHITIERAR